ncbi:lipoyl(octanoyl) transferase LipB [Humisphaera borealis]|uniref:Octanoyltransferase n=1 Tax=Humisphaera borealis TaxID=2807512 RepID=A0A7M2WX32_9BACT|nr:lipoyl(octanoyl) transferase LipB [Humisphaera borealis]QOV90055.1 lipoyl(octanoyl) transferase LipB [Humisphaera borealis]
MLVTDLGQLAYRPAWELQEQAHARVLAGGEEELLLVEHLPVITLGRRGSVEGSEMARNLLASPESLAAAGVEVVQSDRGGDITFHGPGQVVAYPIVRLNDHRMSVGAYVRRLEQAVIDTFADLRISARREEGAVGIWVDDATSGQAAKICAVGVRIKRGISLHGIALNVTTDLDYFNLIVPCGLAGRPVTSVRHVLGSNTTADAIALFAEARNALTRRLVQTFAHKATSVAHTDDA